MLITLCFGLHKLRSTYQEAIQLFQRQSAVLENTLQNSIVSQIQLEKIVEYAPEALLLVRRDTVQLEKINGMACELFGYSQQEIEENFPLTLFQNNPQFADLNDIQGMDEQLVDAYRRGEPVSFETTIINKEGTSIPCEIDMLRFEIEQVPYIRVGIKDLRKRKAQESKTLQQASVIEQFKDAAFIFDPIGTVIGCNQATEAMFGWSQAEFMGCNLRTFYTSDEEFEPIVRMAKQVEREGSWEGEHKQVTKDGRVLDVLISVSAFHNDLGVLEGFITISKDITAQKRSRLARVKSQRVENLGLLAGSIAHDFNNLLGAILLESSLADHLLESDHHAKRSVGHVIDIAERAGDLVNQMLAYSGRGQSSVTQFELNDLVSTNLRDFQATIPPTIQIGLRLSDDLKLTIGDEDQINQTIRNLIQNGVDAIGDSVGRIDIQTRYEYVSPEFEPFWQFSGNPVVQGYYNVLHIIDSGDGIEDEELDKIFDPFFSTKIEKQGLGLSAVLGIMLGHNGGVRVYSKPQIGSKFSLYFPASEVLYEAQDAPEDNRPLANVTKKVLVIDDDEDVQTAVSATLELFDVPHIKASGGKEGIDLYTEHRDEIALIFLDMKMPDIDGDAVYQAISKIDKDVNVLVSSGYHESEIMPLFVGSSETLSFIPKPFNINALINAMRDPLLS